MKRFPCPLAAVLLGAGILVSAGGCGDGKDEGNGRRATAVAVAEVGTFPLRRTIDLPGVVEAGEERSLSAAQPGRIEWIRVKEGDRVEAGAWIAGINEAALKASVALARARLDLAEKVLKRSQDLYKDGAISPETLDRALSERDVAKAGMEAAEAELRNGRVIAPIAGLIDELPMDVGEFAQPGSLIARLVNDDRLEVVVSVPEREIGGVHEGDEAVVASTVGSDRWKGRVIHVAEAADAQTRTFRVRIEIEKDGGTGPGGGGGNLRPGVIVKVTLTVEELSDVVAVPLSVIVEREGAAGLMLERDGTARWQPIRLGIRSGAWVQVTSGMRAGDRLIVRGQREVAEGDPVEIEETLPWEEVIASESIE